MHRWSRKTVATPIPNPNPKPSPNDGRPKRPPHLYAKTGTRERMVLARTRSHYILTSLLHSSYSTVGLHIA
jgi:hypothetical protein